MRPRILLTAFEPYDDEVNASQVLVASLRGDPPPIPARSGLDLAFDLLPVDTTRLRGRIEAAIDRARPDVIVMTGQNPGADKIRIERIAVNIRDFTIPDAAGNLARGDRVSARGPAAYWSTLPGADACVDRLRAAGIGAERSSHAGTYLCNQGLYETLELAAERSGPLAGFVHVPVLPAQATRYGAGTPSMALEDQRRAMAILLATVADCALEAQPPTGS